MESNPAICKSGPAPPHIEARRLIKAARRILIRIGKRLALVGIKSALSLSAACLISRPLIAAAARERGYEGAYGGEWIIIIGSAVLTYCLVAKGIKAIQSKNKF